MTIKGEKMFINSIIKNYGLLLYDCSFERIREQQMEQKWSLKQTGIGKYNFGTIAFESK